MREFPAKFIPKNVSSFPSYKYDRDICYLREAVYEYYLSETPEKKFEDCFNLDAFKNLRKPNDFKKMIKAVCEEIEKLGWKTKVGHEGSSLWVYPPELSPKSLPDW